MDEFQPEDELKPDTSDRPAGRSRKAAPVSKLPLSKQHIMIAIGILILLVLVLGIGSALNGPATMRPGDAGSGAGQGNEKKIALSGDSSSANPNGQPAGNSVGSSPPGQQAATDQQSGVQASADTLQRTTDAPALPAVSLPAGHATLDRNAKMTAFAGNSATGESQASSSTAETTGTPRNPSAASHAPEQHVQPQAGQQQSVNRQSTAKSFAKAAAAQPAKTSSAGVASTVPAGKGYTLQLSAASRADTLNRWAKSQNLSNYYVYKTSRSGQPWYVLISGTYQTPAEARQAISSLPSSVRNKSPWVKPLSLVKKETIR